MAIDAGDNFTRQQIVHDLVTAIQQLDTVLDLIAGMKVRLIDDHTQAELRAIWLEGAPESETLNDTNAKADIARSSILDVETLVRVARAQATVPAANDFFFNARKMTGPRGI